GIAGYERPCRERERERERENCRLRETLHREREREREREMYASMLAADGYIRGKIAAMSVDRAASSSPLSSLPVNPIVEVLPASSSTPPPSARSKNAGFLQGAWHHVRRWFRGRAAARRISPSHHKNPLESDG
ncbi:hypothetical protein GOP47_0022220, partial [Adiantum capillus-veneris]